MLRPHLHIVLSSSRELPGQGLQGPSGRKGGSLNVSSFGSCLFQEFQLLEEAVKKVTFPILLTLFLGGSIEAEPAWSKGRESETFARSGPDPARPHFLTGCVDHPAPDLWSSVICNTGLRKSQRPTKHRSRGGSWMRDLGVHNQASLLLEG